jgi:uncharacterized protein (TIRG00374 family)
VTGRWSRLAAALLGLAVGAVFLAIAFHGTPPEAVGRALRAGDWGVPAATVLLATAIFVYAKSARWRLLLGSAPDLTVPRLVPVVLTGLGLNSLFPHSGEFVRAASLQRRAGRAASGVLSSIVAERVFDFFAVLILGAVALASMQVSAELVAAVRMIGVVAGVLALLVVLALAYPATVERLARWALLVLPGRARLWALRQVSAALEGLRPVRSLWTSVRVLAWSLAQWLAAALSVYGCAGVIGFSIGFAATCLVVVGIVVAFLLPNAPGYAGSVQVAFLVTLRPLGITEEAALAASVVYQLLMVLPLIVVGLACLKSSLARG